MLAPLGGALSPLGVSVLQAPWYLSGNITAAQCVAAYQPKGAASLAASYTNLANVGTFTAAPGVAPTFNTATGWTFNASTQYLTTGITPVTIGQGWSAFVQFTGFVATANYQIPFGASNAGFPNFAIWEGTSGDNHIYYDNGNELTGATRLTAGSLGIAGNKGYRDGVAETGTIPTNGSALTRALYIGALNNGGTAARFWGANIQAFAVYNTVLTASQIAALIAAMAAL